MRLDNKSSLKHYENLLKHVALTVHGLILGRTYYRNDICFCDLGGLFSGEHKCIYIFFLGGGGGGAYYRTDTVLINSATYVRHVFERTPQSNQVT